ncbi:hypothetical protein [Pelagibacterium luteolum]|uniref:Uncharacterized protein n=1 Tax=Pelagibacterium luteolum TaxID=440168 RepID=A0A1G8ARL4_9HYPH|nr:hypothetical protein [Pelagibacterium luteolum]SDH23641.1 hypothetical protein SAMN04487974_13810 [Pelagibacterium luteolum]
MNSTERKKLRDAYFELCMQMGTTHMVTLATHQHWSINKMKALIRHFAGCMDNSGLGGIWSQKPMSQRMNGVFFIEGSELGAAIHTHGLVHIPYGTESFKAQAGKLLWDETCKSGTFKLRELYRPKGAFDYSSKLMKWRNYDHDRIVLLADFMSEKSLSLEPTMQR